MLDIGSKGKYETVHRKAKVRYEKDVMKNYQPSQEFLEKKSKQTIEAEGMVKYLSSLKEMSKNVVVEKEVQEMVGQMWSMEKGVKTKKRKLNKPQGTSRTDTSLSPFLIFKKKADGDGWCEIVQHKGAWDIG